jgi:hypothetical protein
MSNLYRFGQFVLDPRRRTRGSLCKLFTRGSLCRVLERAPVSEIAEIARMATYFRSAD